jgi:hypothetical protein
VPPGEGAASTIPGFPANGRDGTRKEPFRATRIGRREVRLMASEDLRDDLRELGERLKNVQDSL